MYLELVETMALTANNAVAFLSGETSESPTFLAFQDFFLKIIIFDFQTDLSLPHTEARLRLSHEAS